MKSKPTKTKTPAKTGPAKSPSRVKNAVTKRSAATAGKADKSRSTGRVMPKGSDGSVSSPTDLLRAGLSALSLPRAESAVADGLSRIADSFGLKKLEDVFDHRVAAAMERLGYPSVKELQKLADQVAELARLLKSQKTRR